MIIVGGGLAGLSAAHTIIERGGRALVIDKKDFLGGNSVKATSGINGTPTSTQAIKKIPDNAHVFYEDTALSAAGECTIETRWLRAVHCAAYDDLTRREQFTRSTLPFFFGSSFALFALSLIFRWQEGFGERQASGHAYDFPFGESVDQPVRPRCRMVDGCFRTRFITR